MRKVTLLFLALLTVAGAIGTAVPVTEAAGGCNWTCNCAGTPVCTCPPGTSGFCSLPRINCPQIYTC